MPRLAFIVAAVCLSSAGLGPARWLLAEAAAIDAPHSAPTFLWSAPHPLDGRGGGGGGADGSDGRRIRGGPALGGSFGGRGTSPSSSNGRGAGGRDAGAGAGAGAGGSGSGSRSEPKAMAAAIRPPSAPRGSAAGLGAEGWKGGEGVARTMTSAGEGGSTGRDRARGQGGGAGVRMGIGARLRGADARGATAVAAREQEQEQEEEGRRSLAEKLLSPEPQGDSWDPNQRHPLSDAKVSEGAMPRWKAARHATHTATRLPRLPRRPAR